MAVGKLNGVVVRGLLPEGLSKRTEYGQQQFWEGGLGVLPKLGIKSMHAEER
jgi:hypothetical protein